VATLGPYREDRQKACFGGSKSRNKVSVGEPAEGSLSKVRGAHRWCLRPLHANVTMAVNCEEVRSEVPLRAVRCGPKRFVVSCGVRSVDGRRGDREKRLSKCPSYRVRVPVLRARRSANDRRSFSSAARTRVARPAKTGLRSSSTKRRAREVQRIA
jgi:hypothetical protein